MPVAQGPRGCSWPISCQLHRPTRLLCLQATERGCLQTFQPEGSYRELGASFAGPHLQPPESEANKGVHPEEGGGTPEDRLHPFPPQPSLPCGLLALQPLDLLEAEETRAAVRRDPQTAHGGLQASRACVELGIPPCLTHSHAAAVYTDRLKANLAVALVAQWPPDGTNTLLELLVELYSGSAFSRLARVGRPSQFETH